MILLKIQPQLLMSMPGFGEWIIILIIVLLLFGAKKIPALARGIGKSMKEFKDGRDGKDNDVPDTDNKK